MLNKIQNAEKYLNQKFLEREEIVHMMFVCLVARQHMLLIGLPGTAKSALITSFSKLFEGGNYFQWLLTRFSTPEELFGAVSLKELEVGVYKRNTAGKLPEAHLTFLDEIFKANSAILNALLTLINERVFYNDSLPVNTPLMSVFGGSNEYPEEGEGLEALFDRFLVRFELDYITENKNFLSLLTNDGVFIQEPAKLTIDEIGNLQAAAENIMIPQEVLDVIVKMREKLANQGIRPSDRRFIQSLSLLRSNALLSGRSEVIIQDLNILKNGLWETIDQKSKVVDIVDEFSTDKVQKLIDTTLKACSELFETVKANPNPQTSTEVLGKSKEMIAQLEKALADNPQRSAEILKAKDAIVKSNEHISTVLLGATI
ncbi:AAA family ATPase [Lysinibacillus sphaericus]|uniref:AAA family ATPase n=1 Tax=Lysinibacillus sphaericus TaxID=1421 RepID=UPI003F7995BE